MGHGIKDIPIERTTVVQRDDAPALGPVILAMPEGEALCHDALSCTAITGERPATGEKFVAIISVAMFSAAALGAIAQFTPDQARSFAASLLTAADECDGGMKGAH